jgi:hypothetical protein
MPPIKASLLLVEEKSFVGDKYTLLPMKNQGRQAKKTLTLLNSLCYNLFTLKEYFVPEGKSIIMLTLIIISAYV